MLDPLSFAAMVIDATSFLVQFLRRPAEVGAVAPSSRVLADLVTTVIPRTGDPVVVELGPGTGVFTAAIQRRLAGRGRHLAIEINPRFAARLAAQHPRAEVVVADAADLLDPLAVRGHRHADVIVSGLPWAVFPADRQDAILDALVAGLAPDGAFTTFAYRHALWTPGARRLRQRLSTRFEEVTLGRTVWANLPPALVYHCRRPISPPSTISGFPGSFAQKVP